LNNEHETSFKNR